MLNEKYTNKLCKIMNNKGIDAMMIGPSDDLNFLIGYTPLPDERFQSMILLSSGKYFYISPQLTVQEVSDNLSKDTDFYVWGDHEGFVNAAIKGMKKYNLEGKTIGVNNGITAINLLDIMENINIKVINGHGIMEELRMVKDELEIECLRKAAQIADEVMKKTVEYIKPGITEKNIKDKVKKLFLEEGAESISFEPIVASGTNNSMPHYNDDSRVIQEKDIIILDIGGKYKGLCSDMSRTVFVGGITEEQKKVYNIIRKANEAGENFAKEGVKAKDVDKASRDVIEEAGYGDCFINRTGHGIGYSVHEAPCMVGGNEQILEKGMAFSVEPGIYIPNKFGMRIEDIVVISEKGTEVLNKFTKDIIIK
jgi:Xaa-Pro aminopeptidase